MSRIQGVKTQGINTESVEPSARLSMRPYYLTFVILATATLTVAAAAPAHADDKELAAVRTEFKRAYDNAVAPTPINSVDSEALRGYILYPYLQRARILRTLSNATQNMDAADRDAEALLKARDAEPVARELRLQWYASLAARQQWERLLANYRDVNDASLRCHTLTARLALNRFENVEPLAIAMWSVSPASLPACEPAFTWLKSQNALTPELIERRVRLALAAGNADFARQLIATLPQDVAAPLENWAELIERPRQAIDAAIAKPSKAIEPAALLDGWTRFVRADPGAALQRHSPLVRTRQLQKDVASRYALELALALAWNRRPEALSYFARVRAEDIDERGAEWHARAAIWAGDWKRTAQVIDAMPDTLRQQTRWRYWAARAEERRGHHAAAKKQYAMFVNDDNYYAALAAARLKQPYTPRQQALNAEDAQLQSIAKRPAFQRAQELLSVNLREFAYDEWRAGFRQLDANDRRHSIALAAQWDWYDQAILTAAEQRVFDDYEMLYPRPFDAQIETAVKLTSLPAALVYAVVRQESLYRKDAVSAADAKGLMQLQIATAKTTARRWRLPEPSDLFDPNINIPIGAAHVRELKDRFNGQTAIALAAYNAGPSAAARWLPTKTKDMDVWIENIPYNETRTYVQRILWHSVVFGWLLTGNAQDTTAWLSSARAVQK